MELEAGVPRGEAQAPVPLLQRLTEGALSSRAEGDTATEGERQRFEEADGTMLDLQMERWRRGPWAKECRGLQKVGEAR